MSNNFEQKELHEFSDTNNGAEKRRFNIKKLFFPVMGLIALIWFLIRVIPKPSRATYPCQRAAFPIASSFVIWLTGVISGTFILKKVKKRFSAVRQLVIGAGAVAFVALVIWNFQLIPHINTSAAFTPVKLPVSDVAIIQSTKTDVKSIDYEEIKQMVTTAVSQVGGIGSVVKNGNTVVIKPNLIQSAGLSVEVNGVTTDWRVTKAVVELVRSVNPTGKVYVMEEAIVSTSNVFNYYKYTSANIPGVDEFVAIEKDSGTWQDKNSPGLTLVNIPDGLLHSQYYFNRKFKEADVVISLPTMKTHWNAGFTGGIKNLSIGTPPSNIYGNSKNDIARNNMVDHNSDDLHKWIRDYYRCRPANLVIMDGLQGYQNGPIPMGGNPAKDQMNMRVILAGKDAVAVDTIGTLTVGWDPETIGYLRYLNSDKVGNIDPSCINVLGKKVDEVRKYLAGRSTTGATSISDKTPPQLTINSVQAANNNLSISLNTDSETIKELVYIDGQLRKPSSTTGMSTINVDIGGLSGNHQLTVEAYDRFLNRTTKTIQFSANGTITPTPTPTPSPTPTISPTVGYSAPKANQSPVIDGIGNESCWQSAQWKDIKYLWLGDAPTPDDFSGRFKLVWTPERLYYLVEITDDKLSAPNTVPLKNYYDNDCLEIFIDENHSGGNHQNNFNAFALHIELDYDIIDNNTSGTQSYFNDHAKVMRTQNGNVYTWEVELKVFDDTYNENSTNNVPVTLVKDKILGFAVSYNDNDNKMTRESFIGSMDIPGTDKNVAWINASVFDTLKLVESSTIIKGDVNGDNAVNSIDLAIFKSYLLGLIDKFPASSGASAADMNDDGVVDATDYAMLKMYLLGIISSY